MKLALCNEVITEMEFAEQCRFAAAIGYEGLELAPYTVADVPHQMSGAQRTELRQIANDAGTPICGLHWLLVTPKDLSITSGDRIVRDRTIDIMRRLINLCADLGGSYLVHGSPAQRRLPDNGDTVAAAERGADAWAAIAEEATAAGVTYCIEALARPQANFITTIAEAAELVDRINAPGIRTMIDCSAAALMEREPIGDLIDRWLKSGHIAHVQVNDRNRRGPGQGSDEFAPIVSALKRNGYQGWIAVEPFVYEPDGPATAAYCAGYMTALLDGEVDTDLA